MEAYISFSRAITIVILIGLTHCPKANATRTIVVAELEERSFLSQRRLNPGSNLVLCNFVFMLSTGVN